MREYRLRPARRCRMNRCQQVKMVERRLLSSCNDRVGIQAPRHGHGAARRRGFQGKNSGYRSFITWHMRHRAHSAATGMVRHEA
jgi:hypothetical protein